jgi:hypothetical protein
LAIAEIRIFATAPRSSVVLQVLVESCCLACLVVAFCEVGCVAGGVGIEAGREFEIAVLFVEVRGNRFAPRDVFVDLGQRDQLGEYQAQAAIAALHADAPRVEETDWVQIVEWYDELLRFADTPIVRLNRAVAIGEADGAPAGLAALAEVDEHVPRRDAVAAYLYEKNGDLELAAGLYATAARNAPNLAERDHQTRQAARLNQHLQHHR